MTYPAFFNIPVFCWYRLHMNFCWHINFGGLFWRKFLIFFNIAFMPVYIVDPATSLKDAIFLSQKLISKLEKTEEELRIDIDPQSYMFRNSCELDVMNDPKTKQHHTIRATIVGQWGHAWSNIMCLWYDRIIKITYTPKTFQMLCLQIWLVFCYLLLIAPICP